MRTRAHHSNIGKTRNHPRRIGHAFAPTELGFGLINDHCLTAKLTHAQVEGQARAGRWLIENHGQRIAAQGGIRIDRAFRQTGACRFALMRVIQELVRLRLGQIIQINEILIGHHS